MRENLYMSPHMKPSPQNADRTRQVGCAELPIMLQKLNVTLTQKTRKKGPTGTPTQIAPRNGSHSGCNCEDLEGYSPAYLHWRSMRSRIMRHRRSSSTTSTLSPAGEKPSGCARRSILSSATPAKLSDFITTITASPPRLGVKRRQRSLAREQTHLADSDAARPLFPKMLPHPPNLRKGGKRASSPCSAKPRPASAPHPRSENNTSAFSSRRLPLRHPARDSAPGSHCALPTEPGPARDRATARGATRGATPTWGRMSFMEDKTQNRHRPPIRPGG